jgi:hypothetical protein
MSGETGAVTSGWTVDVLHVHLQRQMDDLRALLDERYSTQTEAVKAAFAAQEASNGAALGAQEKAVIKAENAADKRFDLLNELRQGVATKEQIEALALRVSDLKERLDKTEGRSGGLSAGWGYLVGAVGLAGAVIAIISR